MKLVNSSYFYNSFIWNMSLIIYFYLTLCTIALCLFFFSFNIFLFYSFFSFFSLIIAFSSILLYSDVNNDSNIVVGAFLKVPPKLIIWYISFCNHRGTLPPCKLILTAFSRKDKTFFYFFKNIFYY